MEKLICIVAAKPQWNKVEKKKLQKSTKNYTVSHSRHFNFVSLGAE